MGASLMADVSFTTEGVVVITGLVAGMAAAVAAIFRLLMKSKDDHLSSQAALYESRLADLDSQRKSYKQIAEEAVNAIEKVATKRGVKLKTTAAVVPEHASPPTDTQVKDAELQTMRARVTAAVLAVGVGARGDADEGQRLDPRDRPAPGGQHESDDTPEVAVQAVADAAETGAERGATKGVKDAFKPGDLPEPR